MSEFVPFKAQPADISLDGIDVLFAFLCGVSVIESKVASTTELICNTEVQADGFSMAYVKITIRLRWKSRFDLAIVLADFKIFGDDIPNKIAGHWGL